MAKPRIFISSTFYDLRQVRADLDFFIEQMGYESVRNEEGNIPYGKEDALEEYCYKEIKNIDILVCIIGGRFGSESKRTKDSITQMELKTAIKEDKQTYIFIDKNVMSEYETYQLNKGSAIEYRYVDDVRIYEFIEEVKAFDNNNNVKSFETASEITKYLRDQMAGLFQRFLEEQTRIKEVSLIKGLEKTASTLNKLVNFLSDENKDKTEEINKILMINHPLTEELKNQLTIPYNFYIEGIPDLNKLLDARGFKLNEETPWEDKEYYEWRKNSGRTKYEVKVLKKLFEDDGKLKFIRKSDWLANHLLIMTGTNEDFDEEEDLPF